MYLSNNHNWRRVKNHENYARCCRAHKLISFSQALATVRQMCCLDSAIPTSSVIVLCLDIPLPGGPLPGSPIC